MASESSQMWAGADDVRRIVPLFAVAVAVVAVLTDPSSTGDVILVAIPVAAFALWTWLRDARFSSLLWPWSSRWSWCSITGNTSRSCSRRPFWPCAEDVGRRSMQELRRTVALLRSDDEPGMLPPVPSAGEIPALVDTARAGGLAVELRMRGDLAGVPPSVGLAAYRIAQEALANAARHAPRARTALELSDGHLSLIAETNGPAAPAPATEGERRRYGLIGMRERATALGGEFTAGPTSDGWRVSCRLPLAAADEGPGHVHTTP